MSKVVHCFHTQDEAYDILHRYFGGYCALNLLDSLTYVAWTALLLLGSVRTARRVHGRMLLAILRAPMR